MLLARGAPRRAERDRPLLRSGDGARECRAVRALARARAHAGGVRGRRDRRRSGRVHVRDVGPGGLVGAGRGSQRRRRASHAPAARRADGADARAARRLEGEGRARRLPVCVRGHDLRPLRLRARFAHGRVHAASGARAVRAAVRPARDGADRRLRGGSACVPAALRAGAEHSDQGCSSAARTGGSCGG